jgi:Domain of unknown function (DUF4190)/Septum formation
MSDPYAQPSSNPPPQPPLGAQPGGPSLPGSGYPQYTGYPPGPEFPRPAASTNGFAVAALVFGILGGLLGFVFGIIALVQIRRTGQKGTGLAVTGLVLSALWLLVIGVGVVLLIAGTADRDTEGEITEGGSVSAMSLQVGDCLNGLEEEGNVRSLPAVPCAEPHEGEVYATFDLPEGEYPGDTAVVEQAETGCDERLSAVAPGAYEDPSVGLYYLYPVELSWPDDREVVCIAISMSGTTTGSILD